MRIALLSVIAFVLFQIRLGAADSRTAIPDDEIITLPKFEVTAERVLAPLEKWRYASIPGYEILSNASAANTEKFIKDFYLLQSVVQVLLPAVASNNPAPTYIVLCTRGNVYNAFLPASLASDFDAPASFITSDSERSAIVVDFNFNELAPDELLKLGLPETTPDDDQTITYRREAFKKFYRQYFRQIIRQKIQPPPPPWMEEGLVRLFSGLQFTTTRISFEKVGGGSRKIGSGSDPVDAARRIGGDETSGPEPLIEAKEALTQSLDKAKSVGSVEEGGFTQRLANQQIPPLKEFFSDEKGGHSDLAYLFTHMCLFGQGRRYQKAYFQLAQLASKGPITEEIFQNCFKMNYRQMEAEIRGYIEFTDYKSQEFHGGKLPSPPQFTVREATDAESGRIAGEVLRLAGHKDAALQRLMAPYIRGQTDPEMLAALGLAEAEGGRDARAVKFLTTAIKHNTTRARAYYELGRLRLKDVQQKADAENRPLTTAELAFAAEPLKAGLQQTPSLAQSHELLVQIWSNLQAKVSKEEYESLLPGTGRLAKNQKLVFQVAELGINRGFYDSTRGMIAFGLKNARTPEALKLFEELAAKLPPTSAKSTDSPASSGKT